MATGDRLVGSGCDARGPGCRDRSSRSRAQPHRDADPRVCSARRWRADTLSSRNSAAPPCPPPAGFRQGRPSRRQDLHSPSRWPRQACGATSTPDARGVQADEPSPPCGSIFDRRQGVKIQAASTISPPTAWTPSPDARRQRRSPTGQDRQHVHGLLVDRQCRRSCRTGHTPSQVRPVNRGPAHRLARDSATVSREPSTRLGHGRDDPVAGVREGPRPRQRASKNTPSRPASHRT